jgi:hypothetical protein
MHSRSFRRNALAIKALNLCNELPTVLMRVAGVARRASTIAHLRHKYLKTARPHRAFGLVRTLMPS